MAWPHAVSRPGRAAGVAHHDDVAGAGLDLRLVEEPVAVLGERPAVHVEEHRVARDPGRSPVGGRSPAVDLGAVGRRCPEPFCGTGCRRGRRSARSARSAGAPAPPAMTVYSSGGRSAVVAVKATVPPGGVEAGDDPVAVDGQQRGLACRRGRRRYSMQLAAVLAGGDDAPRRPRAVGGPRGRVRTCGRGPRRPTGAHRRPRSTTPTWRSAGGSGGRPGRGRPPATRRATADGSL